MKIMLIRYTHSDFSHDQLPERIDKMQGYLPPLGLAYLAASLERGGYEVFLLDATSLELNLDDIKSIIRKEKPDVVGLTTMTVDLKAVLEASKIAKEEGALVILGGAQLAVYPKETISYSFIDFGIIGEGEYSLVELLKAIESGGNLSDIPGLVYKQNNQIFANRPALIDNLDDLPFPARHLLPINRYRSIISDGKVATIISSRGCPYQCGFCTNPHFLRKHRTRNPKLVVDEIEYILDRYKADEIMFYDDTLTLKREHIVGICNEIINRNLKFIWESPTRLDCIDEELLRLMKKAGCIRLRYGIESADAEILKLMKKETSLEQVRKTISITNKVGIETFGYFIIGYAHEDENTIKKTIELAKKLNLGMAMFAVATPYPQTDLFRLAVENNLVDKNYWYDYTLGKREDRIPYFVKDADKWLNRAYKQFYIRPKYILKRLLEINSFSTFRRYLRAFLGVLLSKKVN